MGVGRADQAELEGVHSDPRLLCEPFDQHLSRVDQGRNFTHWQPRSGLGQRGTRQRFETTEFVGHGPAYAAFRIAFVLRDLDQHLERSPPLGCGTIDRRPVRQLGAKKQPVADVRIVRNHQRVTTGALLRAISLERAPETVFPVLVQVTRRQIGNDVIAKHDVAVRVVAVRHTGPLVTHEARELARATAIVGGFGGIPSLAPGNARGFDTGLPRLAAEREVRGLLHREDASILRRIRQARPAPQRDADERVVSDRTGRCAEVGLTQQLGMVRDHREIQRPAQLDLARRSAIRAVGLNANRLATRKAVRVRWAVARALPDRIE